MQKHWEYINSNSTEVQSLQEALKINPIFCELLVQRDIKTYEEAKAYFRPSLNQLHDPFLMKDMDKAVERLSVALDKNEKILIYGDYDVDGTTSVSLMYAFLAKHHKKIDYYIPDRYKEGYGVSMQSIDYANENDFTLIITIDCGIKALEQVDYANSKGIDFIICDHHLPKETLPKAVAILDPKRQDCPYPYKHLSGCGVAFKFAQGYSKKHQLPFSDLENLLDLLVISIACDVVPITGENRILAHFGFLKLNRNVRYGINALINLADRTPPLTISDLSFGIGPIINAAGRLADAKLAVRLLLSRNRTAANMQVQHLQHYNKLRREHDAAIIEEASEIYLNTPNHEQLSSIVLAQPHWHKGVLGIAASRMVDNFYKPSIILTESNGNLVGSARSVSGFDVHEAMKTCEDLFINFGGHKYAAGLTLAPENLIPFQQRFEQVVKNSITTEQLKRKIKIDATITFKDITPKFWRILKQFAPFGAHNRNPVFCTKGVKDTGNSRTLKDGKHLKLEVQHGNTRLKGIGFHLGHFYEKIKNQKPFDICYMIEENNWKGKRTLQLVIHDIKTEN